MAASELRGTAPETIELLRGFSPRESDLVLAAARRRQIRSRSVITRQGGPADHLLMLWEGRARYFFETANGKKLILRWISPGDIFGGAALVSRPSNYILSTEAVRNSTVLIWDGPTIRALARRLPLLVENVIYLAADYISWYAAAHAVMTSQTAGERLAHVLVDLAPSLGQRASGSGIELDVTNEEMASSANVSPYTVSRVMTKWQRAGAIRKRRGKILLRSPERFFRRLV